MRGLIVLAGSSHAELAEAIVGRLGIPLGHLKLTKFANEEIGVEIQQSVRDMDVYIIQTSFGEVNDHLMELLILVHACRIASAARVTAVVPCFPYARHVPTPADKPLKGPLTARQRELLALFQSPTKNIESYRCWAAHSGRLIASMIEAAGADHVIALDVHSPQFQGFFQVPLDNLPVNPLMIKYIKQHVPHYRDAIIVSPDAGGAKRATELANLLGVDFALIHKNRAHEGETDEDVLVLVGGVTGRDAIIVDDMADTCVTLTQAAAVLKRHGARKIYAAVSHGIFSGDSIARIEASDLAEIIVSNTVPQRKHQMTSSKLRVFDTSPMLAEAIRRTHNGESISYLYSDTAFQ